MLIEQLLEINVRSFKGIEMKKLTILLVSLLVANIAIAQSDDILVFSDSVNDSFACVSTEDGLKAVVIDEPFVGLFSDALKITRVSDRLKRVKRKKRALRQRLKTEKVNITKKQKAKINSKRDRVKSKIALYTSLEVSCDFKALASFQPCNDSLLFTQALFGLSFEVCAQSDLTPLFSRILNDDSTIKLEGLHAVSLLDVAKLPIVIQDTLIAELERIISHIDDEVLVSAAQGALSHLR